MGTIVGIDFGTTNSLIAIVKDGQPFVIPTQDASTLLPSVVLYPPARTILVGNKAKTQESIYPDHIFKSIKKYMGQQINLSINGRSFTPEEISSFILKELKSRAESYLNEKIDKAVITVPAYFNHWQRKATKKAAKMAGLEVVRLINEPTAVSIAYGLNQQDKEHRVLVCDLGGGTFDVSILEIKNGFFAVKSTGGDMNLGGNNWDECLYMFLQNKIISDFGKKSLSTAFVRMRLMNSCEMAKRVLTTEDRAVISTPVVAENGACLRNFRYEITREEFEHLTGDITERLIFHIEKTLSDAGLTKKGIKRLILVGGSSRMPQVRKRIESYMKKSSYSEIHPDKAVAIGAALHAELISQKSKEESLSDLMPLSLGIRTNGGTFAKIIDRNTPLPVTRHRTLSTSKNDQSAIDVYIYQGEDTFIKYDQCIGKITIDHLQPAPKGEPKIKVIFHVDINGLLHVSAIDLATGKEKDITLDMPEPVTPAPNPL